MNTYLVREVEPLAPSERMWIVQATYPAQAWEKVSFFLLDRHDILLRSDAIVHELRSYEGGVIQICPIP